MGKLFVILSFGAAVSVSLLAFAPVAGAFDQTTAQQNAGQTNGNGSNNSLNESYGNALTAVNNFFQMNIPGAVNYGLKAYGQYQNSNQMDNLQAQNNRNAAVMATAGSNAAASTGQDQSAVTGNPAGAYVSPYARLDKSFLYQGSTGEIAGQFETMTGIPRDKMFQMMVDLHTNSKSPNDPDFIPWAMQAYRDASAKMPNADFRAKLDSLGGYLDKAVASGLAQTVLAKFRSAGDARPASVPDAIPAAASTLDAEAAPADAVTVADGSAAPHDDTGLADASRFTDRGGASDPSQRGFDRLAFDPVGGYLGDVIRAQGQATASRSIFESVSAKIRELSERQKLANRSL